MREVIDHIRNALQAMGALLTDDTADGAFRELTYQLRDLRVQFLSEYGGWRSNLAWADGPMCPASFWIAALDGDNEPPEPAVTAEDLLRLSQRLPELVDRASELSNRVAIMADTYRRNTREKLS